MQSIVCPLAPRRRRRALRIAAVAVAPWVTVDRDRLAGAEIATMRSYCAWRGRDAAFVLTPRDGIARMFARDEIDFAIGGLLESPALAACARLLRYAPHPFRQGECRHSAPRRHVWAVSPCLAVELLALRGFLLARRTIGEHGFGPLASAR